MVNMDEILELVVKKDASDVHLICGNKPVLRIARELTVSPSGASAHHSG